MFSTSIIVPGTTETVCANDFDVVFLLSDEFKAMPQYWQDLFNNNEDWDNLRVLAQTQKEVCETLFDYAVFCANSLASLDENIVTACSLDELVDMFYNAIME